VIASPGLDGVLPLLACPHCTAALARQGDGVVGCHTGHRFDIARQGYLSLLGKGSRTDTGDSADMVAARTVFLGAGHYLPVADAIVGRIGSGPILEVGAGIGYYLAAALNRLSDSGSGGSPSGIALDASRYAARRALAAHPAIGSVVADAWSRLPVRDGVIGTVLSVFAPRDPAEVARVLAPGGRLIVVTPEPEHLAEIRTDVGLLVVEPGKVERLTDAFAHHLRPVGRIDVRRQMQLSRADVSVLVRMGPAARHNAPGALDANIAKLPEMTAVTLAVAVTVLEATESS